MAIAISRVELLRLRLKSQGLLRLGDTGTEGLPEDEEPQRAVARLFALQGQDLPGALWSIGLRTASSTRKDVIAAFDRGTLVRTWPFRGTLFVLAAEDVGWILRLTAARTLSSAAKRRENLELDDATFEAARTAAISALQGGKALSRKALLEAFEASGISAVAQRGYHLLWHLSLSGTLVLGPFDGNEQQFALLDEWVRHPRQLEGEEALGELVGRYLAGHGPATEADISWWSKLPLRDIRAGLDVVGEQLTAFEYAGTAYWGHTPTLDHVASQRERPSAALPGFDEFLLGYGDRSPALEPEHAPLTVPGNNGVFKPTIVQRGRVVGLWSKRATARRTIVTPIPFDGPLSRAATTGFAQAIRGYGRFLGTEVEVDATA